MPTFAPPSKGNRQKKNSAFRKPAQGLPRQRHEWMEQQAENPEQALADTVSSGAGFDFSRISIAPVIAPIIQPKLMVNTPGDRYEQEADRVAAEVMRRVAKSEVGSRKLETSSTPSVVQRACADCPGRGGSQKDEEEELSLEEQTGKRFIQRKIAAGNAGSEDNNPNRANATPLAHSITPLVQRSAAGGVEGDMAVPASIASRLQSRRGRGQPLPAAARQQMEGAFGADFSHVRVHADVEAARMSQGLGAKAFTLGGDVYFNRGAFQPSSVEGRRLLGHELVHVVQQSTEGSRLGFIQLSIIDDFRDALSRSSWEGDPDFDLARTLSRYIHSSTVDDLPDLEELYEFLMDPSSIPFADELNVFFSLSEEDFPGRSYIIDELTAKISELGEEEGALAFEAELEETAEPSISTSAVEEEAPVPRRTTARASREPEKEESYSEMECSEESEVGVEVEFGECSEEPEFGFGEEYEEERQVTEAVSRVIEERPRGSESVSERTGTEEQAEESYFEFKERRISTLETCASEELQDAPNDLGMQELAEEINDVQVALFLGEETFNDQEVYDSEIASLFGACQERLNSLELESERRGRPRREWLADLSRTRQAVRESEVARTAMTAFTPQTAQVYFTQGFVIGLQEEIPPGELQDFSREFQENAPEFYGGYLLGLGPGLWHGLTGMIEGFGDILNLLWQMSTIRHIWEYARNREDYMAQNRRNYAIMRAIWQALEQFGEEFRRDPTSVLQSSGELGLAAGGHVGRRFTTDFLRRSPQDQGGVVGDIVGRVLFEVLMEVILALTTAGVGNYLRGLAGVGEGARATGRLANFLRPIVQNSRIIRRLLHIVEQVEDTGDVARLAEQATETVDVARFAERTAETGDVTRLAERAAESTSLPSPRVRTGGTHELGPPGRTPEPPGHRGATAEGVEESFSYEYFPEVDAPEVYQRRGLPRHRPIREDLPTQLETPSGPRERFPDLEEGVPQPEFQLYRRSFDEDFPNEVGDIGDIQRRLEPEPSDFPERVAVTHRSPLFEDFPELPDRSAPLTQRIGYLNRQVNRLEESGGLREVFGPRRPQWFRELTQELTEEISSRGRLRQETIRRAERRIAPWEDVIERHVEQVFRERIRRDLNDMVPSGMDVISVQRIPRTWPGRMEQAVTELRELGGADRRLSMTIRHPIDNRPLQLDDFDLVARVPIEVKSGSRFPDWSTSQIHTTARQLRRHASLVRHFDEVPFSLWRTTSVYWEDLRRNLRRFGYDDILDNITQGIIRHERLP